MAECPSIPKCPFFQNKMAKMPALAEMMKSRYCLGNNAQCARWMVRQGVSPESVPGDLFPSDVAQAKDIIARVGKR
jgi:hypothetical protein